jgi:Leucine-rich repeat (LRR) protein
MPLSEEDATLRLQALARGYIGRLRAIAALNDVWEKVPDLKQGHACYYYNRRTDESSWDKPRLLVALLGPMGDLDEVASPYTEDQAATLVQSAWRRRMAQQIVRLAVAQEWSKAHDEDSGASYYYNARTGEASWVKPVLLGGQDLEDFADHLRLRQEEKEPETYESYDEVGNWVVWQRNADFGDEWVALGWYDPAGNWVDAASAWEAPKEEDAKGAPRRKRMGSGPRRYPRSQAQAAVDAAEDATDNAVDMAERLDLSGLNAHRISARVYSLTRLRHLSLRGNCLTRLSPDISLLVNLTELDCSCNKLKRLPDSLEGLLHLRSLLCAGNCITSKGIPGNVYTLPNLEILDLSENQLDRLPVEVGNVQLLKTTREWEVGVGHLKMLRVLKLSRNALEEYPQQLEKCTRLEELYLDGNKVASVPPAVQQNSALQLLRLEGNRLTDLPVSINMLSELRHLDVSSNKLTDLTLLPPPRGHITQLSALIARDNQITAAPQALSNMLSLRILDLKGNPLGHNLKLEALRKLQIIRLAACNVEANEPALSGFASLTKVEELDLSYNGIPRIPSRTFSGFGHLKELDLGHNQLRTLESESGVGALMQLETLSLRFNRLRELPDDLCRLTALKRLHVRGNELVALPEKLGRLTRLTVLDVGSNLLTALPASTCALTALEELRLDSNKLVELPLSLSPLQSLRMLDLSHNLVRDLRLFYHFRCWHC